MDTIASSTKSNLIDSSFISRGSIHFRHALKRAFDLAAAFFGLLLLSPLFLFVAWRIRRDSPGPVFYRGRRVGLGGREFAILKFRTMHETPASYQGARLTAHDDARVTPLGRSLRDAKLNELPQLWNVLVGEMSLVGPRPEDPAIAAGWPDDVRRAVLSVRPGITSPASVIYRDEERLLKTSNAMDDYLGQILPQKLRLDLLYVRHHGFFTDLDVIFMTLIMLIPRIRDSEIQENLLFSGPLYNLARRYLSWFVIDTVVAFLAIGFTGALWRLTGPLNIGVGPAALLALLMAFLMGVTNTVFGLKRIAWRYASPVYAIDLGVSTFSAIALLGLVELFLLPHRILPLRLLLDMGMFSFGGFLVIRYRERLLTGLASRWMALRGCQTGVGERVLIVGAGECGELAVWLLNKSKYAHAFAVVGYVDDDYRKQHYRVNDVPILGATRDIPAQVAQKNVGLILFAISRCSSADRETILALCRATPAQVVIIPDLMEGLERSMLNPIQKSFL